MIPRIAARADAGAKGFDCDTVLDDASSARLFAAGMRFGVRYLGSLTSGELDAMLASGLACMPVTFGGAFDGPQAVRHAQQAGIPKGATVWLDLEGQSIATPIHTLVTKINMWSGSVRTAGYDPGLYVGANALLTSTELYALSMDRYWHSLSRVVDRNGQLAEPSCGWCMHQLFPSTTVAGVFVDFDFVQQDYRGRVPWWVTRAS